MAGEKRAARVFALGLATVALVAMSIVSAAASNSYRGTLHVFEAGNQKLYVLVQPGAPDLALHPRANVAATLDRLGGEDVAVTGTRHRNDITVTAARATTARISAASAAGQPASMNLAVIAVNFTDDHSQQYTTAQLRAFVFSGAKSAANYWTESTGGRVSITGEVFGWYTLNWHTADACNQIVTLVDKAKAAATAAGANLARYDHFMVWTPWSTTCGEWSGVGEVGNTNAGSQGTRSWIKAPGYWVGLEWSWPAHELGHNLFLNHSSDMMCGAVALKLDPFNACRHDIDHDEYGDPFDVMGAAWVNGGRLLTSLHRAQYGAATALAVTKPGTYTIAPSESPNPSQTQALNINRGDGTALWLEFRAPYGTYDTFGAGDPVTLGITFRLIAVDGAGNLLSYLLDMTPDSDFADSSLRAGKSFTDPLTQQTITVNSVGATGATITIGALPVSASVGTSTETGGTGVLNFNAAAGVNDVMTATRNTSSGRYTLTDTANRIEPGNGCTTISANSVSCAGATSLVVRGSDGDDTITVNSGSQKATLVGGAGNDTLTGGPETDVFNGSGGNDTINAKDGKAEKVACKAGTDKVVADTTDKLKACETATY